jgi:hypothetical protein
MTNSAVEFIGTLTLETLSRHPVDSDVLALQGDGRIGHIAAAHDVEAIVVAPATAHWMAAMANGLAGDTITAACLATAVPVVVAPAMDGGMYAHPATQANVARLREFGYRIVEPESGPLASGMTASAGSPISAHRRRHGRGAERRAAGIGTAVAAGRRPAGPPPPAGPGDATPPNGRRTTAVARATWPGSTSSSPPAARPSRSTPSASSATARPARWASPSPRPPSIAARP